MTDLSPATALDLVVDRDLAVLDQRPGLGAVIDDPGKLQELAEPDGLVTDGYVDGVAHTFSLAVSAGGREAGHTGIRRLTLVGSHGTPHAIWLADSQRVFAAALDHRAANTDCLRRAVTVAAGGAAFAIRVEEDLRALAPAGAVQLPLPQTCDRPREAGYFSHRCDPLR